MPARTTQDHPRGTTVALLYTRVSSDEQGREGLSQPAQLLDCRRYAAQHGWILGHEYQDVMTGRRDDRPRYQALLAEARRLRAEGRPVAVVVTWLHRFGRRMAERVRCWEELKALGVPVHSVLEGGEVPELVANILASVAQEESRQIGERVSSTWQHVTGQGWAKTTRAPWGYRWRPATPEERAGGAPRSVLDIDPATAPYVRALFARVAAGESARGVARWAANLPDEARGGPGQPTDALEPDRPARRMPWRTVQDLLRSPVYVGRPVHGDPDVLGRPRARWPQLVSDQVWQAVQDRIAAHRRVPHQARGRYLLTGLLRCPACGRRMRGQAVATGQRYCCAAPHQGARCHQTAHRDRVDSLVRAEVSALLEALTTRAGSLHAALRRAWEVQGRQPAGSRAAARGAARHRAVVERARQRITRATELLVDGMIGRAAYDDLVAKAQREAETAAAELARLRESEARPALPPLEVVQRQAGGWATVLAGSEVAAQREVLALLLEKVVAARERRGVYRVALTWTPLGEALRASAG